MLRGHNFFVLCRLLGNSFHLAGIGHRQTDLSSINLHYRFPNLERYVQAWLEGLQSTDDVLGKYQTSDRVIEDILGTALLREVLRRDIDPQVPFARLFEENCNQIYADALRVARQKTGDVTTIEKFAVAFPDSPKVCMEHVDHNLWHTTYHRSWNQTKD